MIPTGSATKIAEVIKELGGISFNGLWSMMQWDGLSQADTLIVVKILMKYRIVKEQDGILISLD